MCHLFFSIVHVCLYLAYVFFSDQMSRYVIGYLKYDIAENQLVSKHASCSILGEITRRYFLVHWERKEVLLKKMQEARQSTSHTRRDLSLCHVAMSILLVEHGHTRSIPYDAWPTQVPDCWSRLFHKMDIS